MRKDSTNKVRGDVSVQKHHMLEDFNLDNRMQSGKKARYEQATEKYKLFQQKKDRINQMDSILTVSESAASQSADIKKNSFDN